MKRTITCGLLLFCAVSVRAQITVTEPIRRKLSSMWMPPTLSATRSRARSSARSLSPSAIQHTTGCGPKFLKIPASSRASGHRRKSPKWLARRPNSARRGVALPLPGSRWTRARVIATNSTTVMRPIRSSRCACLPCRARQPASGRRSTCPFIARVTTREVSMQSTWEAPTPSVSRCACANRTRCSPARTSSYRS